MVIFVATLALLLSVYVVGVSAKTSPCWIISPAVMMVLFFIAMILPGIVFHSSPDDSLMAVLGYALWILGSLFGVLAANVFIDKRTASIALNARRAGFVQGNYRLFMFFVLLSVPAVVFTFSMLGRVPLFSGFSSLFGDAAGISMQQARRMNTLEHRDGSTFYFGQGYLRQIYAVISPVFLVAAHILTSRWGDGKVKRLLSIMRIFLVIACALNGQIWISATVILLFVMGGLAVYYMNGSGSAASLNVIKKGILAYVGVIAFIMLYRYFQSLQGRHFDNFLVDTLMRIYLPGAIELFSIFPDAQGFRYGSTWINDLSGMLPGSTQSFAYEVHYLVHGGAWGYTLSPGIVPSAYVNFGLTGIFFTAVVFTAIFSALFSRLMRTNSAVNIAIAIYISHSFTLAMPGDIGNYVVSLATSLVIYAAYHTLNSFFRPASRSTY
jgi:uncharacterized membrane protein